jgi:predicted nucleic acid-binding protein
MPARPLASISAGEEVFLDANVIVYGALALSAQSHDLLHRCARREVSGYTTVEVMNDVCHRLMVGEAAGRKLIARPNAANLKGKSQIVRGLSDYWQRIERLRAGNIAILPLDDTDSYAHRSSAKTTA